MVLYSKNGFLTSPFTVTGAVKPVPSRPTAYALEFTCHWPPVQQKNTGLGGVN
jgi:hypothetical protein